MRRIKLRIQGMTCVSCEALIEKRLKQIPGLKSCRIDHRRGEAEVACASRASEKKVVQAIRELGYKVYLGESPAGEPVAKPNYGQIIWLFLLFGGMAWLGSRLDLGRFLPDLGGPVTVWLALLVGLAASLSTCLALTGGLVMSFGAKVRVTTDQPTLRDRLRPHWHFHLGRIGGFFLLGGLLGLIGERLNLSLTATGWLTAAVALLMFYIGLSILGLAPNVTRFGLHLPKSWAGRIDALKEKDHRLMPVVLGALTFFLPCGFTQSMQLAAAASQGFWAGGLIMAMFALGTLPVLLTVGLGSTYAHGRPANGWLYRAIGVLVILFSIYSFNSGLVLAGSSWTIDLWNRAGTGSAPATSTVSDSGQQVIQMEVDWKYSPDRFTLKRGVPVRWEVYGKSVNGCSNRLAIPSMGLEWPLREGWNVLEFTPTKSGRLPFSCWMGMIRGEFTVID